MSVIKLLDRPMIILLSGRPASGKSVAIKSIVKQICESKKPSFGLFYVSTKYSNDYDYVPDECLHEDFSEEHLATHINKIKKWKRRNPKKKVPQNLLCIDDSMGKISWYSSFWSNLISTHRHWGTTIILATQSLTAGGHGSSTLMRNCVDMAVLYHSSFIQSHKNIYNSFVGWFPSLKEFINVFMNSTKKRGKHWAMVYLAHDETLKDTYMAWKAPLVEDFKIKW